MLEIKSISIEYNKKKIISDFSLKINQGEVVALTGPSGAGKSSILYAIAMLKEVTSGEILINNKKIPKINTEAGRKIYQEELGFIFQDFLLIKDKTVRQNLELVKYDNTYKVEHALEYVKMEKYIDYKISQLSGGQQQRIAISRLFMKPFNIVLGDEITGSLDKDNKLKILEIIKKLKEEGKAIILVTHDNEVANFCDKEVKINEL